ncbi:MAG: hypothetical protein ABI142_00865 [Bryocella sp.]
MIETPNRLFYALILTGWGVMRPEGGDGEQDAQLELGLKGQIKIQ